MKTLIGSSLLLLGLLQFSSCGEDSDAKLMAPLVEYISDTMFARRKPLIKAEVDSLCLILQDEYKWQAIDSILSIERTRIKELSQ